MKKRRIHLRLVVYRDSVSVMQIALFYHYWQKLKINLFLILF
jgi:hypothetical protein